MADTVITTPSAAGDSSAAGWAVAIVVLAVVLIGAFVWFQRGIPAADSGTDINVTVPSGSGDSGGTGNSGGAAY